MATGIYWPEELPCWLLEGHEGQYEDIYARTEVCEGPARLRRMYMAVPQIRKAELFLQAKDYGDDSETKIFHEFFENTLDVGALRFMAPFRAFSGGTRWYECEFVEPWNAEFVALAGAKRAWRVKSSFRLHGEGILKPENMEAAEFEFKAGIILKNKGKLWTRANLSINYGIELIGRQGVNDFEAAFGIQLKGKAIPDNTFSAAFSIALAGHG